MVVTPVIIHLTVDDASRNSSSHSMLFLPDHNLSGEGIHHFPTAELFEVSVGYGIRRLNCTSLCSERQGKAIRRLLSRHVNLCLCDILHHQCCAFLHIADRHAIFLPLLASFCRVTSRSLFCVLAFPFSNFCFGWYCWFMDAAWTVLGVGHRKRISISARLFTTTGLLDL